MDEHLLSKRTTGEIVLRDWRGNMRIFDNEAHYRRWWMADGGARYPGLPR